MMSAARDVDDPRRTTGTTRTNPPGARSTRPAGHHRDVDRKHEKDILCVPPPSALAP
jgi:hypothetical protein